MDRTARWVGTVGSVALVVAVAGCGSDKQSASPSNVATSVVASIAQGTVAPSVTSSETGEPAEITAALTGAEICQLLPAVDVGEALAFEVSDAVADDTSTPQCAYHYTRADGTFDNVAVAALRSVEDLGGRTGKDAFDYVVEINRGFAAGTEVTETEISAGDGAIVLVGESLNFGVIDVGGRVVTIIVSTKDATGPTVEALVSATALALA